MVNVPLALLVVRHVVAYCSDASRGAAEHRTASGVNTPLCSQFHDLDTHSLVSVFRADGGFDTGQYSLCSKTNCGHSSANPLTTN